MANTASAEKAARQGERRRLHNRYYAKTTRNAIRDIRNTTDKAAAQAAAPAVFAKIEIIFGLTIDFFNFIFHLPIPTSREAIPSASDIDVCRT